MPCVIFTHAASFASTRCFAIFLLSCRLAAVMRMTILSVMLPPDCAGGEPEDTIQWLSDGGEPDQIRHLRLAGNYRRRFYHCQCPPRRGGHRLPPARKTVPPSGHHRLRHPVHGGEVCRHTRRGPGLAWHPYERLPP